MNDFVEITREKCYRAVKKAKPLFAWFSLTDACNLDGMEKNHDWKWGISERKG